MMPLSQRNHLRVRAIFLRSEGPRPLARERGSIKVTGNIGCD